MDIASPSLKGSPLEDEERVEILISLDPDSLLFQYLTWLENQVEELQEKAEDAHREVAKLRRYLNRRQP